MARFSGERVGRFTLGGQIGDGPHGEVYFAEDPAGADGKFVVKVVRRYDQGEDDRLRRYRAEVEALETARILGVLRPGAFSTLDQDHIGFVQQRSERSTLRSMRGALPPTTFIEILKQVATTLGKAHKVGCFHGHLNESNIFVDIGGSTPAVEISGFGTVHLLDPEPYDARQLLHDDIFALGLVAFREVSGKEYRGPEDLQLLIRESVTYPIRFCQAVERWLDPDPARRPQKIHQVVGLLEYALASTNPAQSFPVGVAKAAIPSAAIIRPPRTSISEISESLDDGGANRRVVRQWRSCGGHMLWLDEDGVLRRRDETGEDRLVDTGGTTPGAFAIAHDSIAFVAPGGEVHVIEDSGIRRVSQLGRDALAVAPSSRLRRFMAATVDGRIWFKSADEPRPLPVGFLNPDDGIDLILVGEKLLVQHADQAWIAPPSAPDSYEFVFDGVTRIDGGYEPRTFVVWTGRRWSLYDLEGELLETGRTGAGPRPGRMDGSSYSTYRDLVVS